MNVQALQPDVPDDVASGEPPAKGGFGAVLDAAGSALDRADRAEHAFVARRGGLVEMMVERANADVMLLLATTAAQRTSQALSTLFGMQV